MKGYYRDPFTGILIPNSCRATIEKQNKAHSQEPRVIIPVGRTAHTIKPFYVHKVKVKAIKIKAKKASYCPPQEGDYQCPMPKGSDEWKGRGRDGTAK